VAALEHAGVRVFALPSTIAHAHAHGLTVPDAPLPEDGLLGDVIAFFPGAGHSDDNLVVWVPSARVLFGGCLVKSSTATDLGNIADADLSSWPQAIARVREKFPDAEVVVPGHGPIARRGGGDALGRTLELLRQRGATTTAVP
jgi:glyoxylase-like metal-dependent hydrolase (beta-lactamase superfamily II)